MDLLVLGADGLDPRLTQHHLAKGNLPTIQSLLDNGGEIGPMASRLGEQNIPHTGPAWTTIYTGETEREHGVTYGGWRHGHVSFTDHYTQTIFHEIEQAGRTYGSFTMPVTYPATVKSDESWMVAGFPASDSPENVATPNSIRSYLPSEIENMQARKLMESSHDQYPPVSEWVHLETKKRKQLLPSIVNDHPTDVLFYGTQIVDVMGHRCRPSPLGRVSRGVDLSLKKINQLFDTTFQNLNLGTLAWNSEMKRAYQEIDYILSDLLNRYDPDHVLIISDHGFRLDGREHSFVGTSIISSGLYRPEYIPNVQKSILDALKIKNVRERPSKAESSTNLSESEQADIKSQLDALGYRE